MTLTSSLTPMGQGLSDLLTGPLAASILPPYMVQQPTNMFSQVTSMLPQTPLGDTGSVDLITAGRNLLNSGLSYSMANRLSPAFVDCSSYVTRSLRNSGIDVNPSMTTATMPRDMAAVGYDMLPINWNDLRAGDIVYYPAGNGHAFGHTGIYSGNGFFLDARNKALGVGERPLFDQNGKPILPFTHIFRRRY